MQGCFECTEAFILVSYSLQNWSVGSKTAPEAQKTEAAEDVRSRGGRLQKAAA